MAKKQKRQRKVKQRRPQRGDALISFLKNAAKLGYKLRKDKRYKRMGTLGVTGRIYNFRHKPWEV